MSWFLHPARRRVTDIEVQMSVQHGLEPRYETLQLTHIRPIQEYYTLMAWLPGLLPLPRICF